jgi:hypothetical protein
MRNVINRAVVLIAVALCLSSCFRKEVQGTMFRIEVSSKNVESDPITHCTSDLVAYAFYVGKGEKWEVASWEDAVNMRITNTDKPSEVLEKPDVIGTYDPAAEYQICFDLKAKYTVLVVVDLTNRIYVYRNYETPMNLSDTYVQLHLYAYSKSGSSNGWTFTNPFPDDKREPLVPVDDTEEEVEESLESTVEDDIEDETN